MNSVSLNQIHTPTVAEHEVASDTDAQALIAVDRVMQRAFLDRDGATLDAVLTDDYVLISSDGSVYSKRDVLAELAAPDNQWEINESSDWQVRVYGDCAIVVAILHQRGFSRGRGFDNRVKFSDTYLRQGGRWRNVHAHASRLNDVAPTPAKE